MLIYTVCAMIWISTKMDTLAQKRRSKTSAKTSVKTEGVKRLKTIQGSINMEENLRVQNM